MDWTLTAAERAFRDEVRDFLATALTPALREAGRRCSGIFSDFEDGQAWHRILAARGWSVPHWPREQGGTGWSPLQHYLFARELAAADAPPRAPMGTHMVAPVILAFGTPAQQQAWLPGIRSGADYWCQGYSEPNAGSDLASLQCRAVRDGEHYVLHGTKIWTTHAQHANRMFCLVRTSTTGKPQQGISFLCFDMATPGITVRPLLSMSGDHELNQVFFDDVRVPVSGRIGEENQGWAVAKYLLQHERGAAWSPLLRRRLARMRALAAQRCRAPGADPWHAREVEGCLATLEAAIDALEATELSALRAQARGEPPGIAPSMGKIAGSELRQRLTELHLEIAGPQAAIALPLDGCGDAELPVDEPAVFAMSAYLNDRAASIYAGTNEIQRNIVAAQLLAQAAPPRTAEADDPALAMLCESLSRYLNVHAPVPREPDGADSAGPPSWWRGLVTDLGLLAAAQPEADGGLGGPGGALGTHMALMRVLGASLAGEPYLSHAVLGLGLLQRMPGAPHPALLSAALEGRALLACAHAEAEGHGARDDPATQLVRDGPGWRLSGRKSVVIGGAAATHLLVSASTAQGLAFVVVPADAPGLSRRPVRLRDGAMATELRFEAVPCADDALIGPPGEPTATAWAQVQDEATLVLCAEAIGVLTRLRDDTLAYVRQRQQFGAPLASFQAVQHRLVDMQLALTQAAEWGVALQAAPRQTPAQRARAASSAALAAAQACRTVGQGAVQLHGGMGMTQELAVGHFFRRATLIGLQLGAPAWHAQRLAALARDGQAQAEGALPSGAPARTGNH